MRPISTPMINVGQHVLVRGAPGVIRFIGETKFAAGEWLGIELDHEEGRNDGSVQGIRYFNCEKTDKRYGIFTRRNLVVVSEHKHDKHKSEKHSLESKYEQIMVDRQYFEEENQSLKQQLEELQLKHDELAMEFHLLKEEVELQKDIESEISEGNNSVDLASVLAKNKQLELTLLNLRNVTQTKEDQLKQEIEKLESHLQDVTAKGNVDDLVSKLDSSEQTITYLKEQLDSSLSSEKIIESLNVENEKLNEEITELKKSVNELTELHVIDQGLEETHALVEHDLRDNIKELEVSLSKGKEVISKLERKLQNIDSMEKIPDDKPNDALNLQNKIEFMKIEIKKYTLRSFHSELAMRLAKSKADLLESSYSDRSLEIKKVLAKCNALLEAIPSFPRELVEPNEYMMPFLVNIIKGIFSLSSMAYASNNIDLTLIDKIIDHIQADDLKAIDIEYFNTSVREGLSTDKGSKAYFVACCELLISESECAVQLVALFQRHSHTDALGRLHKEAEAIKEEVQRLRDALAPSDDILVSSPSSLGNYSYGVVLESFFKLESYFETMDVSTSLEYLDSVLEENYLYFKGFEGISTKFRYEAFLAKIDEPVEPAETEAKQSYELTIKEKDHQISEMKLSIDLLESNLDSIGNGYKNQLNDLRKTIDTVKTERKTQEERYLELLKSNSFFQEKYENLLRSSELIENGNRFGLFQDVESEKRFNVNMDLLEENSTLRKALSKVKLENESKEDLSWLQEPLMQEQYKLYSLHSEFEYCSSLLQKVVLSTKRPKIIAPPNKVPLADTPKYVAALNSTKLETYKMHKKEALSGLNSH